MRIGGVSIHRNYRRFIRAQSSRRDSFQHEALNLIFRARQMAAYPARDFTKALVDDLAKCCRRPPVTGELRGGEGRFESLDQIRCSYDLDAKRTNELDSAAINPRYIWDSALG